MTYTSGPWDLFNNVHPIRGDAMTPEEIGQLIADRVRKTREEGNGTDQFLFVSTLGSDERTICDIGNGPNGMINGQFIVAGEEMLEALLAVERVNQLSNVCDEVPEAYSEWLKANTDAMEKVSNILKKLRDAGVIKNE